MDPEEKAQKYPISYLLSDIVEEPLRGKTKYAEPRRGRPHHGLRRTSDPYDDLFSQDVLRGAYPNFFSAGFGAQAFIDIVLAPHSGDGDGVEVRVRNELQDVSNVVLVYTVFGGIDLRCKVVAPDLKGIETTSREIRKIVGVESVATSIVVDETDYDLARSRWARLIIENCERIEAGLQEKAPPPKNRRLNSSKAEEENGDES